MLETKMLEIAWPGSAKESVKVWSVSNQEEASEKEVEVLRRYVEVHECECRIGRGNFIMGKKCQSS